MPPPLTATPTAGSPFVIGAQAGADYADLALFQAAQAKDLETPGERITAQLQDGHFDVSHTTFDSAAGWVTSEANHVEITCEPGAEHDGTYAGRKCGIFTSDYAVGAMFDISCWVHKIAGGASGPWGDACFAFGETASSGDVFYFEELVIDLAGSARNALQVNCIGGTGSRLSNISVINLGDDWHGIWFQNAGTNYCYAVTVERVGTAAAFRNEYGADVTYKNCISYGGGTGAAFFGSNSAATDYNISDDATAPGTNNKRGVTPTFVAPNDNHLDPSDTVAQGWGENLYANADYPVTVDIDGDTRPDTGQWDAGCDQVAVAGPVPLSAAVSAQAAVTATLVRVTSIAAAVLPSATVSATLRRVTSIAAAVLPSATVSATLRRATSIAAAVLPSASVASSFVVKRKLSAAINVSAAVSAAPEVPRGLVEAVSAQAVVGAQLLVRHRLSAAIDARAAVTISAAGRKKLEAAIDVGASVTSSLFVTVPLQSSISAAASVNALLLRRLQLPGAVAGSADVRVVMSLISDVKPGLENLIIPGSGMKELEVTGSGTNPLIAPGSGAKILEID